MGRQTAAPMETRRTPGRVGQRSGSPDRVGHDEGPLLQPADAGPHAGARRGEHRLRGDGRRRRLRRARRILSRGLPGAVPGPAPRAAGQVGGGSARAFPHDQPLTRAAVVGRGRRRRARATAGARRHAGERPRRLPAYARRLGGSAHRVLPARTVPVAELSLPRLLRHDEQDADGHRARARILRGHASCASEPSTCSPRAWGWIPPRSVAEISPGRTTCPTRSAPWPRPSPAGKPTSPARTSPRCSSRR